MKAWHIGRPRGLTVMDQLLSVVKMQKGDVSFRLTAEVKHKSASPCSDLSPAMSTVIQPHLSITTLPTDTQSTTGDSWPWQRTWVLAYLFNALMSKNSTRCYQVMYCSVVRLLMPWCWDNRTRSSASTWLKCALYSTHKWHNKIHFEILFVILIEYCLSGYEMPNVSNEWKKIYLKQCTWKIDGIL